MGLLIDSTAFIHAERNRETPEDLIAEVMERWGDAELWVSVMSAGDRGTRLRGRRVAGSGATAPPEAS